MPISDELSAYFQRIEYSGSTDPTLETLCELHQRHVQAIPFENLNPLLSQPVPIDTDALHRKLVVNRRGGYCFEQNLLFRKMLQELGFQVTGLSAGVVWNMPPGEMTGRTHALLRIDLDGEIYLADVGFGGQTLTGPLQLKTDVAQSTPHEPFRLIQADDDELELQSQIQHEWRPLYRFNLRPQRLADYEVGNWYVAAHPQSIFVNNLMVSRVAENRRHTMLNNNLATHHLDGPSEKKSLTSVAEIRDCLTDLFGIKLPEIDRLDSVLARFVELQS